MPINTEIEDKKTKFNHNNKNILLHSSITFPFYPDLGKNLGNLGIGGVGGGGVFCNFGFGLREKVGNLDFLWGGIL